MLNFSGQVDLTDMQNQPDYFTKSLYLSPLVAMFCTEKLSIVVADVVECTHSTNRDIECVQSIK